MTLKLVVGNKNYSSWSLRACLAMWACDALFDEVVIPMYNGEADKRRILEVSPSGKVPVLIDGDVTVWDSLAIIEYLNELFPDAGLWPKIGQPGACARRERGNAWRLRRAAARMRHEHSPRHPPQDALG